jgi:hypothetical protein
MTVETAETSPSSVTPADAEVTSTPAEATTDAAAASSTATDAKEAEARPSLLSVLKDVVEPKEATPEGSSPAAAEKPAGDGAPEAPKELTDAEIAELPFHNHPRFKQVVDQKNALKGELETATTRLQELERPAEQWGNVRGFMEHNGISDQDMLDGFKMMAMIRTDPLAGRAAVASYLSELDRALGLVLPDDLREDVENGYMSEERAKELSQARATTAQVTAERAAQQEQDGRAQAAREAQELGQRLTSAAESWEAAKRARDPDFEAKADLIADRMRAISLAERKTPKTPEEINALLDRAHTDVTAHLRRFVPAPRAVSRPTSAAPATVAAPAPSTMREAMALAARGR